MPTSDHHSAYLARAVDALTPEGRRRVDELLEQLTAVIRDHDAGARFAAARKTEADLGRTNVADRPATPLSAQELEVLIAGFRTIRDHEPRDDVADWANAVVALLEDEAGRQV